MKVRGNTLCILLGLSLMISGCSLLPKEEEVLQPPLVQPVQNNTETYKVQSGTIVRDVKGIGKFETTKIVTHQFTGMGGIVEEVLVKSGDIVNKGDLLIQLEIEDLDILTMHQELDLERAKNNFRQAHNSDDPYNLKIREMELEIAQRQYQKTSERLASRQLIAEIDGTVVFVERLEPLQWVDNNAVLVSIGDTSQLQFFYEAVTASDIAAVQVGMEVEVNFEDNIYIGTVTQTPYSSPSTNDRQLMERYAKTLYMNFDEFPEEISIGDTADFVIVTEKKEDTLIIPKRGLRSYLNRDYVYILDGESRHEVDVEVGIRGATQVEIISGIEEGQLVILQ